ncbi:MAG: radical SAM protein, partial [Prevotella sp.]|nr:radical SAM protein [Prevotella sp.]
CRHRLTVDGAGVTTLVAFHGCPLHCKYCLNSQCLSPDGVWRVMTAADIMAKLQKDDLYFRATGGGVCFGGGEPLLRSDMLVELSRQMPHEWAVTIETSLNVPLQRVEAVAPFVSQWIIDIKDMNPDIYQSYTGIGNLRVRENLLWLAAHVDKERILIRLPLIPRYNTPTDVADSRRQLEALGFTHFDEFEYITR